MRLAIDSVVTCSDASMHKGAVMASTGLTLKGEIASMQFGMPSFDHCEEECLLVSAFDGIGGLRRAFDLIGLTPAAYVSSETDMAACRVERRAWGNVIEVGDIIKITDDQLPMQSKKGP